MTLSFLANFAHTTQILGWLATFIWFASIWFVYKDTVWHRDRTGPLASLYRKKSEQTPKDQAGQAGQAGAICVLNLAFVTFVNRTVHQ